MTRYQILRESIPWYLRMSRYTKAFTILVGVMIGSVMLIGRSNYQTLKEIYELQTTMSEILDLEIHYMAKQVFTEDDTWIKVNNVNGHIYSSYLDIRPEIVLKYSHTHKKITWADIFIIALLPTKTKGDDLTCVLNYEDTGEDKRLQRAPAQVRLLHDHWNLEYSAFFIICDLTYPSNVGHEFVYSVKQLPESVGIESSIRADESMQFIDVHYPKHGLSQYYEKPEKFMTVCVPVLHHNFDRALELIEFIEYYGIMGIDHFTFYKSSVSSEVEKVLEFYQMRFTATVLNWNLSSIYIYEQTLRQQGLFAALNDCLYRNTYHESYKYVGTFDVDEFLVPRKHNNLTELMRELDPLVSDGSSDFAAFLFRNVYFYTMYQDDESIGKSEPYLYTRAKTKRLKNPHEAHERSRYIVRGWDTVEIGNYNVWEFREGSLMAEKKEFNELVVDPEIALLHHYAPCEAEETGCYLKPIEIDKAAQRFSEDLRDRVGKVCSAVFGKGKCPSPKKRTFS